MAVSDERIPVELHTFEPIGMPLLEIAQIRGWLGRTSDFADHGAPLPVWAKDAMLFFFRVEDRAGGELVLVD